MKIAFLASECAPYLKTGGLGDVVQALPEALSKLPKVEVSVFLPYYSRIKYSGQWKTDFLGYFDVQLAWRREYVGIFRLKTRKKKLQVYFLDNEQYFNRPSAYGYPDDGERFAYFSRACLESLRYLGMQPDIVHCHDWADSPRADAAEHAVPRRLPQHTEHPHHPQHRISGQMRPRL